VNPADRSAAAEGRHHLVADVQRQADVGELALQPAALLERDDRADQRRARGEREPVNGERDDARRLPRR
jgi:hypothetical protein